MFLKTIQRDGERFWVGEVLLLLREETEHNGINLEENLAYVQYMKFTEQMDRIVKVFVVLAWNVVDRTRMIFTECWKRIKRYQRLGSGLALHRSVLLQDMLVPSKEVIPSYSSFIQETGYDRGLLLKDMPRISKKLFKIWNLSPYYFRFSPFNITVMNESLGDDKWFLCHRWNSCPN